MSDENSLPVGVPDGGSTTGINAALLPLRPITGTVMGNGQPVGGINVTAHQFSSVTSTWEPAQGAVTGPDGTYALHLADGTYRVGFTDAHGPYRTVFFDGKSDVDQANDIVVAGGGVANIDANMALNHSIPRHRDRRWREHARRDGHGLSASSGRVRIHRLERRQSSQRRGRTAPTCCTCRTARTASASSWSSRVLFGPGYYNGAFSLDTATDVVVAGADVWNIDAVMGGDPTSGPAITGTVTVAGGEGPPTATSPR